MKVNCAVKIVGLYPCECIDYLLLSRYYEAIMLKYLCCKFHSFPGIYIFLFVPGFSMNMSATCVEARWHTLFVRTPGICVIASYQLLRVHVENVVQLPLDVK